jgi:hypothetical protein
MASLAGRPWGGINLGVEPVALVLVNLLPQQMADALAQCRPDHPGPVDFGELGRAFLRACADYPITRLHIDPGEGYSLPGEGLLVDHCTRDNQEPVVLLLLQSNERT